MISGAQKFEIISICETIPAIIIVIVVIVIVIIIDV